MSRRKINDDVIKFIRDNCTISAAHLKESIKDKFGVELSLPSIYRYLREFRENTQIETSAINEEIKRGQDKLHELLKHTGQSNNYV